MDTFGRRAASPRTAPGQDSSPAGSKARGPDPGAGEPQPRPHPRARSRSRGVAALTAATAAGYAGYALVRFHTFRTGTYDLVIFDQAVRSYSRLLPGVAIVKGVHNGFGPDFSVLGDHFSPLLALLAPLYLVWDDPRTLLLAQAVLLAAAIPPLWVYTRRALGSRAAYCVASAYAIGWPVIEAVAFDFHEVAFVPLLTALLLERHQARRWPHVAVVVVLLLLVKEDMGLLVAGFGLYLLTRRGERWHGAALAVTGLFTTWLTSRILIPAAGGDPNYYWAYGDLGQDLPSAALHALGQPWDVVALLAAPPVKLQTLALLFLPLLLAPLRSPVTLAAVPLLLERMLAGSFPNWWASQYHYNAFIVVVLLAAGVDGVARATRTAPGDPARRLRYLRLPGRIPLRRGETAATGSAWAAAVLAGAVLLVPFFSFKRVYDPGFYRQDVRARAAAEAVAAVPDGALVEAANYVGPQLSGRTRVLLWDWEPRWAPWVVADEQARTFPFTSLADQRARLELLRGNGYRTVFRRAGYVVLHRPGPDPVLKGSR